MTKISKKTLTSARRNKELIDQVLRARRQLIINIKRDAEVFCSLNLLSRYLNKKGIKTPQGKKFTPTAVQRLLKQAEILNNEEDQE